MTKDITIFDIVTDSYLHSVLDVSALTHEQCVKLSDLAAASTERPSRGDFAKQQKLLHAYISQLRTLNFEAILQVRQSKQATADARQEVDRLYLQLQNLDYQQLYLRMEIAACEAYDHKYQHLSLAPVEEFLQRHPELAEADENALMIARIHEEHAQREALEQARQGLLKRKQGLIAENKKRRDDLANLDRDLEKFIDAAKPIQKILENSL
ncbi:MAG: hypothetical protein M1823_003559 [Watsoniomyces obsoletus]|nr:MAG: hypothetical protein M1823_003559 [Watsoniomyces obsoletus]